MRTEIRNKRCVTVEQKRERLESAFVEWSLIEWGKFEQWGIEVVLQ